MISIQHLPQRYLDTVGAALLLGATGSRVVLAVRKGERIEPVLTAMAVGALGLAYYPKALQLLLDLGKSLETQIKTLGDPNAFMQLVWKSIRLAADEPDANGKSTLVNVPAVVEQLFRVGVWGTVTLIGDFFFLLADTFIQFRRDVLSELTRFFFPIICGIFPLKPQLGITISTYLVEMSLWGPCLYLIHIIAGNLAPQYLHQPGSWGVPIVAIEIIATLLILDIPRTVHQLFSGLLFPAGESAALGLSFFGIRLIKPSQVQRKQK